MAKHTLRNGCAGGGCARACTGRRHPAATGGKWIRPAKRVAIYLRDGMACVWCGAAAEDGAALTLDHVVPWSRGGNNRAANLVTACRACNSARGNRSAAAYARTVAAQTGAVALDVWRHVRNCRRRAWRPHVANAIAILARRRAERAAANRTAA